MNFKNFSIAWTVMKKCAPDHEWGYGGGTVSGKILVLVRMPNPMALRAILQEMSVSSKLKDYRRENG
jgi:hypothetical protein